MKKNHFGFHYTDYPMSLDRTKTIMRSRQTNSTFLKSKRPPSAYKCKYTFATHRYKEIKQKDEKGRKRRKKKSRSYCFHYYKPLNLGDTQVPGSVWLAHIHISDSRFISRVILTRCSHTRDT